MNSQIKKVLKDAWTREKILSMDFRGIPSRNIEKLCEKLSIAYNSGNLTYGRAMLKAVTHEVYHVIGYILPPNNEEAMRDYFYSYTDMLEQIEKYHSGEDVDIYLGYEVLKKNADGVLDLTGKEQTGLRVKIRKGEAAEAGL